MGGESGNIVVTLPDGNARQVPVGTTPLDLARQVGGDRASSAVAVRVDGEPADLNRPLARDARIEYVAPPDPLALEVLRHSTAHATAQAV